MLFLIVIDCKGFGKGGTNSKVHKNVGDRQWNFGYIHESLKSNILNFINLIQVIAKKKECLNYDWNISPYLDQIASLILTVHNAVEADQNNQLMLKAKMAKDVI